MHRLLASSPLLMNHRYAYPTGLLAPLLRVYCFATPALFSATSSELRGQYLQESSLDGVLPALASLSEAEHISGMPADSYSTSPTIPEGQSRSSNRNQEDFAALPPSATATANLVKTLRRPHSRPYRAEGAEEVGQERRDRLLSSLDVGLVVDGAIDCEKNGDTRSKKRPFTDELDYPRRRATIAVCFVASNVYSG